MVDNRLAQLEDAVLLLEDLTEDCHGACAWREGAGQGCLCNEQLFPAIKALRERVTTEREDEAS
jgi:hypothetical protein